MLVDSWDGVAWELTPGPYQLAINSHLRALDNSNATDMLHDALGLQCDMSAKAGIEGSQCFALCCVKLRIYANIQIFWVPTVHDQLRTASCKH